MSLDVIEDFLVDQVRVTLAPTFDVAAGPGEWSARYLQSVVKSMPAARVGFLTSTARDSTALTLDTRWAIYLVVGYALPETERRRPALPAIGTYRAACLVAPRIHKRQIVDEAAGVQTFARVDGIENLWAGDLDVWRVSLVGIDVTVPLALDEKPDGTSIDEFLRAGVDFDLPDEGEAVDLDALVAIPPPAGERE